MRFYFLFCGAAFLLWAAPSAWAKSPATIYAETSPSVVLLLSYQNPHSNRSKGTGSLIAERLVLTNAHVVLDSNETIYPHTVAYFKDESMNDAQENRLSGGIYAQVIHLDRELDLALLQLQSDPQRPLIALGNGNSVHIGDPVLAIGHPENGGLWSLTSGRIGAKIRNFEQIRGKNVFQTEASLNRGNSGGPLLDENGWLIGVNTSVSRQAKDGFTITGINFALTSNVAHQWLASKGIQVPLQAGESASLASTTPSPPQRVLSPPNAENSTPPLAKQPLESAQGSLEKSVPPKKDAPPKNRLLTPKRPFREDQLFQSAMDELEQAIENRFEQQEDRMETLMDKAFQSF